MRRPPPFVNLYDVAGITMTTAILMSPFLLVGMTKVFVLLGVVFVAALFFAKRGEK